MEKLFKSLAVILLALSINTIQPNLTYADNHTAEKKLIEELKKEIYDLGAEPQKRAHLFQRDKNWIADLQEQLAELKKQKEEEEKLQAAKKEIEKEIEALGGKPISKVDEIDLNQEIVALRKQLAELKAEKEKAEAQKKVNEEIDLAKKEIEKEIEALGGKPVTQTQNIDKNEEVIALRKQLAELKAEKEKAKELEQAKQEEKAAAEALEKNRGEAVQSVKNEILFLGETPISEYEASNEDQYIAALNKQLDEIKALKEQEEKEIQQSIPDWFIKLPKGSEQKIYVRGTAVVDTLQGAIDSSTNAALRELGKKLETRLNSKLNETVRQAGIGEDITTKTEITRVSSIVVKEVTISGYEIAESKLVQLDNGKYRSFILLEYPVAQVYKAFMNRMEQSPEIKKNLAAIKNTEAYKELETYVNEFTSA
jgi:DNA repair exonuclease SbcCD ATPase subunit